MVSYSVTVSIIINVFVCLISVVGIFLSIWSHVKNFGKFFGYSRRFFT